MQTTQTLPIATVTDFLDVVASVTAPPGLDYETNGKPFHHPEARLVGISLALPREGAPPETFYIPVAHRTGRNADPGVMAVFTDWLVASVVRVFYLPMEVRWSRAKLGVSPRVVGDAYYAARLLQLPDEGLKALVATVLGEDRPVRIDTLVPDFDFSRLDAQDRAAHTYAGQDALDALVLSREMETELKRLGMQGVYELEILAALFLAEQEAQGYVVAPEALGQLLAVEQARLDQLQQRIWVALGGPFNLQSPRELGTRLKRLGIQPAFTSLGNESWSLEALKAIEDPPPEVEAIIDWKKAHSVITSIHRAPVSPDATGRVWPHWLSMGNSGTPRIYSERPQLVSYPKVARGAFVAPEGQRWFMVAYLQPEMRALAVLARETRMQELLNTSYDFYTTLGATLRGAQPGEGTEADREQAKRLMYAVHDYAGDAALVGQRLKTDGAAALATVYDWFPALPAYFAMVRRYATLEHEVWGFLHRRWQLDPGLSDDEAVTKAMAALSQHTVASWLKFVLVKLASHAELGHPSLRGFRQVLPVFDRFFYVIDADVPVVPHLAYMHSVCEPEFDGVRFRAEYGVGPSWGDIQLVNELAFAQVMADFQQPPGPVS